MAPTKLGNAERVGLELLLSVQIQKFGGLEKYVNALLFSSAC
jgi:hypothetical protein